MAEISRYFFEPVTEFEEQAAKKHLRPVAKDALQDVRDRFAALSNWSVETIHQTIQGHLRGA